MKIEINTIKNKTNKSKVKTFFDKIINDFIVQIKRQIEEEQNTVIEQDEFIDVLNNYLENNVIVLTLDKNEQAEFERLTRRNYKENTDYGVLYTTGKLSAQMNNPKQLIRTLTEVGIQAPLKVSIGTNVNGNIYFTISRNVLE